MSKRIITLGKWNDKPIEWIVASENDRYLFCVLRSYLFSNNNGNSVWKHSSLRQYLNGEFFQKAFNDDEKRKIINVFLSDTDTKDNVFLLSVNEFHSLDSETKEFNNNNWYATRTFVDSSHVNDVKCNSVSTRNVSDSIGVRFAMYIKA